MLVVTHVLVSKRTVIIFRKVIYKYMSLVGILSNIL